MDKDNGGAKPKTGPGVNNNNSSNSNSNSKSTNTSQAGGAMSRNRSPRRDNGYAARLRGGRQRAARGHGDLDATRRQQQMASDDGDGSADTTPPSLVPDYRGPRRASVPQRPQPDRGRNSHSTQTRAGAPTSQRPSFTDYSPLRGGGGSRGNGGRAKRRDRLERGMESQMNNIQRQRGAEYFMANNPMLSFLNRPQWPSLSPSNPIVVNTDDSDSGSDSPSPPSDTSLPRRSMSLNQLAQDGDRPMSASSDAEFARQLLQTEMDTLMQRDEEIARQLQDELDRDRQTSPMAQPLAMFMPGGSQGHRHFMNQPRGWRREPGGGWNTHGGGGRRSLEQLLGGRTRGRGRGVRRMPDIPDLSALFGPQSQAEPGPQSPTESTESDANSPNGREFDPDERLLGGDLDPPDDFLSMMNDPSLMLLMLLLRAPDSLHRNEDGVDLDNYEELWELAERLGEVRRRGISEDQINRLPTLKFKATNGEPPAAAAAACSGEGSGVLPQCQICLVDFENGDCLRCIPCKHDFHRDCIDEWLKRNATCPICRQEVKAEGSA